MCLEHVLVQGAICIQFHDQNPESYLLRQHLPWHNVAVVLHAGQHHAIALLKMLSSPCLGDQIDAVCRPAHEEDFLSGRCTNVATDDFPGPLVSLSGLLGQRVDPAVDVAVFLREITGLGVDDRLWLVG